MKSFAFRKNTIKRYCRTNSNAAAASEIPTGRMTNAVLRDARRAISVRETSARATRVAILYYNAILFRNYTPRDNVARNDDDGNDVL